MMMAFIFKLEDHIMTYDSITEPIILLLIIWHTPVLATLRDFSMFNMAAHDTVI